jgi:exodeoxyribonuclease V alpha subunit
MLCQFSKLVYPQSMAMVGSGSYMVAIYKPCEKVLDSTGNIVSQIKAVGYALPTSEQIRYEMKGQWSKNAKHGLQFEVETYDEVIKPTKEGIIAYLSSGQIKGVGPKLAERIYSAFGNDTLDVLDHSPEKLTAISGISDAKLKKICDSYLANRGARDVIAFLTPYGITPNRAVRLYKEYGNEAMNIVKKHPYRLCELAGIAFKTADKIAMSMGFDVLSPERIDEGILYTLTDAEKRGHLCIEKDSFIKECLKTLETPGITDLMVGKQANELIRKNRICVYDNCLYSERTYFAENTLSIYLERQISEHKNYQYGNLDAELDKEEKLLKIKFAPEQRDAVKTALTNSISIITGGPGTGKTLIQKAILDIYSRRNPRNIICCCAPTGRAARRMEESTGYESSTVHKTLCLMAGEDGEYGSPENVDADFVLIDETSMLDIYLSGKLFSALKPGTQTVFVGDADQLPSVGPGAVLSEMIASGRIPTVRLDKVFRQTSGSRIATNAKLIKHGNLSLEYGDDFQFIDSADISASAEIIAKVYVQEVNKYGVDNVALLTPYRQKTDTGANALNERIREIINPKSPNKAEISYGKKIFRCGDKVMQIKNHIDVNNGDIGYITKIERNGNEATAYIDFGDGRLKEYDSSELDMLELGYASTIHKSQGSEYRSVIINLQKAHYVMLTRPLIYTAITRGKERVIFVGERKALCTAIKRTDTEQRGTRLAKRLCENLKSNS